MPHRASQPNPLEKQRRLLQNHDTLTMWIQRLVNAIVIIGTLMLLAWWRDGVVGTHYRYMAITAVLLMLLVYHYVGVHRRFESHMGAIQQLARAWGVVVIILAWVAFLTKTSEEYSRQVIFLWVIVAFILQAWLSPLIYLIQKRYQQHRQSEQVMTLVIGTGDISRVLASSINRNVWLPDTIVGMVTSDENESGDRDSKDLPVLGSISQLTAIVRKHRIRRVYIALPLNMTHLIGDIQSELFDLNIDVIWAPDIFSLHLLNHSVREVAGIPLLTLSETPLIAGGPAFLKALMDKAFSVMFIILLSPVFLITAAAIKITSPGPILFKQKRHGWDGRVIEVWKFRSMVVHNPEEGAIQQATKNDSRITPVGNFIRKTSIDELPQFINVLQGRMSLVGPRPHAVEHNEYYSDKVSAYISRHRIKPGITGLAQVNGYRGETETLDKMQKRIEYDLEYINNWSPWLDFKILVKTPFSLFSKNAY